MRKIQGHKIVCFVFKKWARSEYMIRLRNKYYTPGKVEGREKEMPDREASQDENGSGHSVGGEGD